MAEARRFTARIEQGGGGGAYVIVPFDVEQAFGARRVAVRATIDGVPYRGSLVRMGSDCHVLGVLKEIRARLGKEVGDTVEVVVEQDTEPRVVEVPDDLRAALAAHADAAAAFESLSYSHRREYVGWILEAKRDATRASRIERAIAMLREGRRRP